MSFKMEIIDNYDHVISEKGNSFIALRKIRWGDSEPKLDLRKYYVGAEGEEKASKGVCFDDEAADELAEVLVESGYGNTAKLKGIISNRQEDTEDCGNESTEEYVDIRAEMMG